MHRQWTVTVLHSALMIAGLFLAALLTTHGSTAYAADPLTVDTTSGASKVRFDNLWQTPHAGMILSLPAIVSTGDDGSVRLRQGETFISVASNTAIELSASAADGTLVQTVVQDAGSAFYDIAPQETGRFRVESPYLAAVVKGTQFNVTVTQDATTVALFEGLLQVDAPTGSSVDIVAGQIARRQRDETEITVIDMNTGDTIAGIAPDTASPGDDDEQDDSLDNGDPGSSDDSAVAAVNAGVSVDDTEVTATANVGGVTAAAGAGVNLNNGTAGLAAAGSADLGGTSVDADVGANADLGSGMADINAGIGGVDLDLGLSTTTGSDLIDLGAGSDLIDTGSQPTGDTGTADDGLVPDLGDLIGL